jgi:thymidine kinase
MFIGPMFSGKSSELLRHVSRWEAIGKKTLLINHTYDTRTKEYVSTHNKNIKKALKISHLMPLTTNNKLDAYDIIGIDEAQFFPDLKPFILKLEKTKKQIYISGLDGDFQRKPFGQILDCIPLCDTVIKFQAMDMISNDGTPAPFTKRISEKNNDQIVVGAGEIYKAVNRENFLKHN